MKAFRECYIKNKEAELEVDQKLLIYEYLSHCHNMPIYS